MLQIQPEVKNISLWKATKPKDTDRQLGEIASIQSCTKLTKLSSINHAMPSANDTQVIDQCPKVGGIR